MKRDRIGTVISLFISINGSSKRLEQTKIIVDEKGIQEDKFYNGNILRSILLTSIDSYHLASKNCIDMPFGSLGENLLIDYNPYHLNAGDRLQIGNVILEISQNCTICDHLSKIDAQLPELLKDDRGIFAKVVKGGEIKKEDEIFLF